MSCYRVLFIRTIISPNTNLLGQVDWGLGINDLGCKRLEAEVLGL